MKAAPFLALGASLMLLTAAAPAAHPGSAKPAQARRVAAPAKAPARARDWSRFITLTPEGGFRMGNPAAPVKIVEYASLTCPYCAHFARTGEPLLVSQYVRTGKASYEFRNFVLNGIDVAATLLARCAPPQNYFNFVQSLYTGQEQWVGKINKLSAAEKGRIQALPEDQRLAQVAQSAGLIQSAAAFGVPGQRARQCLTNKASLDRIEALYNAGAQAGVSSTPTFFVNGTITDARTWEALEPLIKGAG